MIKISISVMREGYCYLSALMTHFKQYFTGAILLLAMPVMASAATISLLTEAEYLGLVTTGELAVETFEIYPEGFYPASQDFSNFQYSVSSGAVTINSGYELNVGFNNTLSGSLISDRLFEFSPADQIFAFGTDMMLSSFGSGPQTFEITVTGNSGVSVFQFDRTSLDWSDWNFSGFHDPLGLISIGFSNLGYSGGTGTEYSNYKFDNVMTLAAVPLPPALILFASGLLALMPFRRRQTGSR